MLTLLVAIHGLVPDASAGPVRFQSQVLVIESVTGLAHRDDGRVALSLTRTDPTTGRQLSEWDAATGILLRTWEVPLTAGLSVGPEERLVASEGGVFDLQAGSVTLPLPGVRHVRFVPGTSLIAGQLPTEQGSGWRVWDAQTGAVAHDLAGAQLLPDHAGRVVLRGIGQQTVEVVDLATGSAIATLSQALPDVACSQSTEDGTATGLITASAHELTRFDLPTGRLEWRVDAPVEPHTLAWEGSVVALAPRFEGHLWFLDASDGRPQVMAPSALGVSAGGWWGSTARSVTTFLPGGDTLLAGGGGAGFHALDAASGRARVAFRGATGRTLDVHSRGSQLLVDAGPTQAVLWDLEQLAVVRGLPGLLLDGWVHLDDGVAHYLGTRPVAEVSELITWDLSTSSVTHRTPIPDTGVNHAAFDAVSGHVLIGAGHDFGGTARLELWRLDTHERVSEASALPGYPRRVALAPGARRAAALLNRVTADGGWDFVTVLWDPRAGHALAEVGVRSFTNTSPLAFSPDGNQLLAAPTGPDLLRLDAVTGVPVGHLPAEGDPFTIADFHPQGDLVLAGTAAGRLVLWETTSDSVVDSFDGLGGSVVDVDFAFQGDLLVWVSEDRVVRLRRLEGGPVVSLHSHDLDWVVQDEAGHFDAAPTAANLVAGIEGDHGFRIDQLAASANRPDRLLEALEVGSDDLRAHFRARHRLRAKLASQREGARPTARIEQVTIQGNTAQLSLTLGAPRGDPLRQLTVYVGDVPTEQRRLRGPRRSLQVDVPLLPGANKIEIETRTRSGRASLRTMREVFHDPPGFTWLAAHGRKFGVWSVSWSDDGTEIVTAGDDGHLRRWRSEDGALLADVRLGDGAATAAARSPQGQLAAYTRYRPSALHFVDEQLRPVAEPTPAEPWVSVLRFGSDGDLLRAGTEASVTPASGGPPVPLDHGDVRVLDAAFVSADVVVTSGVDGVLRQWNARSGALLASWAHGTDALQAVAVLPDGRVATGSADGTIRLQDLSSPEVGTAFPAHAAAIQALAAGATVRGGPPRLVSGGCQRLALHDPQRGCDGVTLRIWGLDGTLLDAVAGAGARIGDLAIEPGGGRIAAAMDTSVLLWDRSANAANRPDLYVVGVGISDYAHEDVRDLRWAHRDVEDLAATFLRMDDPSTGPADAARFRRVHVRTLTDAQATRPNIASLREHFDGARTGDVAVLFVAGHGLHDDDPAATYYYLTHDADPDRLHQTALPFEELEALLAGIAPRNKLLLLDTCESGEVIDDLAIHRSPPPAAQVQGARFTARALEAEPVRASEERPRVVPHRNRWIYEDLRRRTGAIVLSSSLGHEASLEHDRLENGVFTEALLRALAPTDGSRGADTNGDGRVSTDELRTFVIELVPELTGDLQHPTVDRDNLHQVFDFPLLGP